MCGFDIPKLTRLKSVSLHNGRLDELQCETLLHILSTLNAPGLQQIILVIQHSNRFMDVKEVDKCLAERFRNLELLTVECDGRQEEGLECSRQEIQEMLLQMLQVQIYTGSFYS